MLQEISRTLLSTVPARLCLMAHWFAGWHAHACKHDTASQTPLARSRRLSSRLWQGAGGPGAGEQRCRVNVRQT